MGTTTQRVSFCFDDGFHASAEKIRKVFDQRGLSACFCVLAAPELAQDPFIRASRIGDWGYWRETMAAGHEVAPHGYQHELLGQLSIEAAQDSVRRTLDKLTQELPSFDALRSIYHVPYLRAPPPTIEWIGRHTLGARIALGKAGLNTLTDWRAGAPVDCMTFGPDDVDTLSARRVERFIQDERGWLVLVFHGLDGEGWGTLSLRALEQMLDRLADAGVPIEPPNRTLCRSH